MCDYDCDICETAYASSDNEPTVIRTFTAPCKKHLVGQDEGEYFCLNCSSSLWSGEKVSNTASSDALAHNTRYPKRLNEALNLSVLIYNRTA